MNARVESCLTALQKRSVGKTPKGNCAKEVQAL